MEKYIRGNNNTGQREVCGPVIAKFLMNITLSQLSGDEMAQLGFHAVSIESISLRDHLKRIEPIAFGKLMDGHISRGN